MYNSNCIEALKACICSSSYPCVIKLKSSHWIQDEKTGEVTVNYYSNSSCGHYNSIDIVKCLQEQSTLTTSMLIQAHGYPKKAAFCLENIDWHHHLGRNEMIPDMGDQIGPHNTPLLRTTHLI